MHPSEIPFVRILPPLIIGILLAIYVEDPLVSPYVIIAIQLLLLLCFVSFLALYKALHLYRYKHAMGIIPMLFILCSGYQLTILKSNKLRKNALMQLPYRIITIKINSEPQVKGNFIRCFGEVKHGLHQWKWHVINTNLMLTIKRDSLEPMRYQYGDLLLVPASISKIAAPNNPHEFNYKQYMSRFAVYHQAFVEQRQVLIGRKSCGNPIIAYALTFRKKLVKKFHDYIHDQDAASVASTLILGYRADLNKNTLNTYAQTGTMHVLAVSGMHVALVFMAIAFLLKGIDRSKGLRLLNAAFMVICIWLYALLTGFSASICRAVVMLSCYILSKTLHRHANTYNVLACSATLLLLYNPLFLIDVGFQLSYLAVFGLAAIYPLIYHAYVAKHKIIDNVWACIAVSLSAQLATFPLCIYYFHQFPLYFLLSNLLIALPVTWIMYTGLVFLLVSWHMLLKPLSWVLEHLLISTNYILKYINALPLSNINGLWIQSWECWLMYTAIIFALVALWTKNKAFIFLVFAALIALSTHYSMEHIQRSKQKQIIFYSLQKNLAIGFFTSNTAYLISQLHPTEKRFQYHISPSLAAAGIDRPYFINLDSNACYPNFWYKHGFIQFYGWKMMLWNKRFDGLSFSKTVSLDAVLLSGNPSIDIGSLIKHVHFHTLLIDAQNPNYKVSRWVDEAKALGYPIYVLKNHPAYMIRL